MTPAERATEAALLALHPGNIAVTLTWNELPLSAERIRRDLRQIHGRVDRQILGRRFNRFPADGRSRFWAIIEKIGSYPHCHLGWLLPPERPGDLDAILRHQWRAIAPAGRHDLRACDAGWAGYATKALSDPRDIIYSEEFLPSN